MPKIKICGVNNLEFALEAERLGANYLGFILVPGTPRFVTAEFVEECLAHLQGTAQPVLVFRDIRVLRDFRDLSRFIAQVHKKATKEELDAVAALGFREVWSLNGGAVRDGILYDTSHT